MKIFKVLIDGIVTNQWTNENGMDETHYEPCFGKPEREIIEDNCTEEEIKIAISSVKKIVSKEHTQIVTTVLDKNGKEITPSSEIVIPEVVKTFYTLPAEYEIIIEDAPLPTYAELRIKEYNVEVDPFFIEAVMEKEINLPGKMDLIIQKRAEIKLKYPKPVIKSEVKKKTSKR